tara:strand:- start:7040 stop:7801 length:762 start_codon:yes stop_codon:yes gene_type:complete
MGNAKDLEVKLISANSANKVIKNLHYSGKVVSNSTLHFGIFYKGKCGGAMSYGHSINKKGTINLVKGTGWNNFIELNRMAFADWLPRYGESRCIAYTIRYIKKHYPHIGWILSFADGTQCGDGTIYRASGFDLLEIRKSNALRINPDTGEVVHTIQAHHLMIRKQWNTWEKTKGYQLKYIYFINKKLRKNLTVPILPYSDIDKYGAGMYKGKHRTLGVASETIDTADNQFAKGGEIPTATLHKTTGLEGLKND